MNAKSLIAAAAFAMLASVAVGFMAQKKSGAILAAERARHETEVGTLRAQIKALEDKVLLADKERDKFKGDAAEVHKLRGELSALRKAKDDVEKAAARGPRVASNEVAPAGAVPGAANSNYSEIAQFATGLRTKVRSGTPLTAEETAWLQQVKPELEKLESSPENFAAFQASMIQSTAGITDPQKVEKIQAAIQKVYENAVQRGLTLQSRPQDDSSWIDQRHQLDRRGTGAVQRLLSEEERAAFDRAFLGIMGVDLGTGVDKTVYPPGFIRESPVSP